MDRTTRRQIKEFEKRADEVARLKERAADLLKKAGEMEVAQKSDFDAVILRTAYAVGLDALPLSTIVAGLAALSGAGEATIDLVVEIGRNTSKERFAVLDQYLTWNGRDGEWSGKVTKAILSVFEGLFEPRQLKYSVNDPGNAESGSSNTPTPAADNAARDGDLLSPEPQSVVDGVVPMAAVADDLTADAVAATELVHGVPATQEPGNSGPDEGVALELEDTAEGVDGQRPETIGMIGPLTAADDRRPAASLKPAAGSLPRSPFAGLRRRGQG